MEYNKLAKEIHQDQKEAGWYDELRSDNTLILLIKSELFEAFEAYRKEPKIEALGQSYLHSLLHLSKEIDSLFVERFKENVKDSFADELADTVIRLLDFAGYKKLDLIFDEDLEIKEIEITDVLTTLVNLDYNLTAIYHDGLIGGDFILWIIRQIEELAVFYEIGLETHIKLKLAYNKTRGKRHGNKAV